jgi:hypothetical protein
MAAKYETVIIRDLSEVPAGYERLSWFASRVPGKQPKTVTKYLSEAHATGMLPAVKVVRCYGDLKTGAVFLDKAKAIAALREQYETAVVLDDEVRPQTDSTVREMRALASEMREAVSTVQSLAADLRAAVELLSEKAYENNRVKEYVNGVA